MVILKHKLQLSEKTATNNSHPSDLKYEYRG